MHQSPFVFGHFQEIGLGILVSESYATTAFEGGFDRYRLLTEITRATTSRHNASKTA